MGRGYFSSIKHNKKYYDNRTEEQKEKAKISIRKSQSKPEFKEKQKLKARELRALSVEIGNCVNCFNPNDTPQFKMCSKCREKFRGYNKKKEKKANIYKQCLTINTMEKENKNIKLNQEQINFLIGVLENIKGDFDISDSLEYGCLVNEILEVLENA